MNPFHALATRTEDLAPPTLDVEMLISRGEQRLRRRRRAVVAAAVLVVAAVFGSTLVLGDNRQAGPPPVDRTGHGSEMWCPEDRRPDCFAGVHGRIVYSGRHSHGIRVVNPTDPTGREELTRLTDGRGEEPLEWSGDGTKLLIRRMVPQGSAGDDEPFGFDRAYDLVVLNADGTQRRVAHGAYQIDGSISPDGSQVVFTGGVGPGIGGPGIYTVQSDGGTSELLLAPRSRRIAGEAGIWETGLYSPEFSPDGTQIAYFDGMGDWGHSLRVMSSDGTDVRVLLDRTDGANHIDDLVWSPDGQRLMFAFAPGEGGIWVIGVDGSGLTQVVPDGVNPAWSPDGTRISYQPIRTNEYGVPVGSGRLRIADMDGSHVTTFNYGGSGPWNPVT